MQINFVYDASVNSAPAAFKTALQTAATILDNAIANPITETIQVGWGENAGSTIPSNALATGGYMNPVICSYSQIKDALTAAANTNGCAYMVANLPATSDPNVNNWYSVAQAQAAAIGLSNPNAGAIAGSIGFNSSVSWAYSQSSIGRYQYDLVGAAIHEITHALGRFSGWNIPTNGVVTPFDLYDYSAKGVLQMNKGAAGGYFSVDGGVTNLSNFDADPNGDSSDWASTVHGDAFGGGYQGQAQALNQSDLLALQALGYDIVGLTSMPVSQVLVKYIANQLSAAIQVVDTAAHIQSNLDSLQTIVSAAKISSLTVTDTPSLTVTAHQLSSDAGVLAHISGNYTLSVTSVSAGNASSIAGQSHVASITVSDTVANVAANLNNLQTLAASGKLASISFTDSGTPVLTVTAVQQTAYATAIHDIVSPYTQVIAPNGSVFYSAIAAGGSAYTGGTGINTVVYSDNSSNYTVAETAANNATVSDRSGHTDTLTNIQRLQFVNNNLALDIDGNAGFTAKVIGATFGADKVANQTYEGIGIRDLDGGMNQTDLVQLAINAALGAGAGNSAVVNLLYTHIVGVAPAAADLAYYTNLLDSGIYTQAGLAIFAADCAQNINNIDLVGLAHSGIQYV
ncbi:MAG: NF038122 family metalloprotease [Methylobacter sp.]